MTQKNNIISFEKHTDKLIITNICAEFGCQYKDVKADLDKLKELAKQDHYLDYFEIMYYHYQVKTIAESLR